MGLVRCRFHAAVDDVRAALTGVTDPTLLEEAGFHLTTLESIAATGDDPVAWRAALGSENPVMRRVAREWILETGDAEGLRAIEATFPVLDDGDRTHLFATLARHPRPELFARIEEVLAGPEYDDPTREEVRRWAAWAALRAGTDDAARVLAQNVKRREGRDYLPFMYWIELRPDEALPWIGRTRTTRLMAFRHDRAYEQQTLDRLERRMRRGLPPDGTDGTPDDLKFQM